ncbi:MAG: hypothetical protein H0V52_08195 [Acidimicrobiia bacterium]|nr:hypothetical protein [Acidimicrobiia bacterium]
MLLMVSAGCSDGDGGFLSRAPEESREVEGGPYCGPLEELDDARRDLIIRATSNLEIESVVEDIRSLQEEIAGEAPAELRQKVELTNRVYGAYLDILIAEGYGKAPMDTITSDEYNQAALDQVSFCFQNPGR